jgi:hypothetical protein
MRPAEPATAPRLRVEEMHAVLAHADAVLVDEVIAVAACARGRGA